VTELSQQRLAMLFSDIEGSTLHANRLGDQWKDVLRLHRETCRRAWKDHNGHEVDTAGDGFLATFPLPSRAVACAAEMLRGAVDDGIHLRIGLHVGEVTVRGTAVTGMAVHVAARVAAQAEPDSVLATEAVPELLVGVTGTPSFEPVGERRLKGVPGSWRLHRALL